MTFPMQDSTPEWIIVPAAVAKTTVVGQSHTNSPDKGTLLEDYLDAKVARASLARFKEQGRKAFISSDEHKRLNNSAL